MGLIHPIASYDGKAVISFPSCRALLPDPLLYEACIRDSFTARKEATLGAPSQPAPRREAPNNPAA